MEKQKPIVSIPAIKKADVDGVISQNFEFKFKDKIFAFSLEVPKAIYLGAKHSSKKTIAITRGTPKKLRESAFFRAFCEDPVQKPVIIGLLRIFRGFKEKLSLDNNQYFEMLLAFVQQLPYDEKKAERSDNDMKARFPVETLVEKKGLCGEKSSLLGALLKEEGYDIALLFFPKEEHMMVGIRPEEPFGTMAGEYTVLEVTYPSLPGDADEHADEAGTLYETPLVIPIGRGTLVYGNEACREVNLIQNVCKHLQNKIDTEDIQIEQCVSEINKKERYLAEKYSELQSTHSRIQEMSWVEAVSAKEQFQVAKRAYNSEVKKQRVRMDKYMERGMGFNQMVAVYNFILKNTHNRPGIMYELEENFNFLIKVLGRGNCMI